METIEDLAENAIRAKTETGRNIADRMSTPAAGETPEMARKSAISLFSSNLVEERLSQLGKSNDKLVTWLESTPTRAAFREGAIADRKGKQEDTQLPKGVSREFEKFFNKISEKREEK